MIDIRIPTKPTFAGCYTNPASKRTHETTCVIYRGPDQQYMGREICMNANGADGVDVVDVTDKQKPKKISVATYPDAEFAHQGWFSEDQRYFFLGDEFDDGAGGINSTRTIVFNMTDLDDPVVQLEFRGTTSATDHNLYVRGRYMFQANYRAGLRVIDIADPKRPKEVGYFDTFPDHGENAPGFAGAWIAYPYFKGKADGVVAVSSFSEGLFLVRFHPPQ